MKAIVIYDSTHGNTEQIARAIGGALGAVQEVTIQRAGDFEAVKLKGAGLLIVGAPTNGGRPTQEMQNFLNQIGDASLQGIKVAAFDTRLTSKLVVIFGYAAGKIADTLQKKGGNLILEPEGFLVTGSKGPLKEGELERAVVWAGRIKALV
jgi:flavodoxin I